MRFRLASLWRDSLRGCLYVSGLRSLVIDELLDILLGDSAAEACAFDL